MEISELEQNILSKDKVYTELFNHFKALGLNTSFFELVLKHVFSLDDNELSKHSLDQRLTYMHYRLFFTLCMDKLRKTLSIPPRFSFIDTKYHPGQKLVFPPDGAKDNTMIIAYFACIFSYENINDHIFFKLAPVDMSNEQFNWDSDTWLDWPVQVIIMPPHNTNSDDKNLGIFKLRDISKQFIIDIVNK